MKLDSSKKNQILKKLCYTELVYQRINKKLGTKLSKQEIQARLSRWIEETPVDAIVQRGNSLHGG